METVLTTAIHELTVERLFSASEDVLDDVYDCLCDIEMAEIDESYAISERGRIAADIVTVLGNAIAKANGTYDEEAFFSDLSK